jgi:hypothetical protein
MTTVIARSEARKQYSAFDVDFDFDFDVDFD